MKFAVAGAGFSGAVIARELAEQGHRITVFEERDHVGGNCHTCRDEKTGILVHTYGPHIFHTDCKEVWEYLCGYCVMMPFIHRVRAVARGRVYSLPINLLTINQFFGLTLSPSEAFEFVAAQARCPGREPENFEEQMLSLVGNDLYQAFFHGYTLKQWGVRPDTLPAAVARRLPVRFDYDDNYFRHQFQGMPKEGYTPIFERLLDHPQIDVHLNSPYQAREFGLYDHLFYSGPIDRYFDWKLGRLKYRTLHFDRLYEDGDFQGTAVLNYCDEDVAFTRVTEHKHLAPWDAGTFKQTVFYREYSGPASQSDTPFYPVRLRADKHLLAAYVELARTQRGVSFLGRLGTYRYLDMDRTIAEALSAAQIALAAIRISGSIPTFFTDPMV